ncbi:MAG: hypothetical protein K0Q55_2656 [Verrucomicrobia bacterium]|jgi:hypothetical protein|nr:hypothetical protein [Verrucomicrobiota bacterium]
MAICKSYAVLYACCMQLGADGVREKPQCPRFSAPDGSGKHPPKIAIILGFSQFFTLTGHLHDISASLSRELNWSLKNGGTLLAQQRRMSGQKVKPSWRTSPVAGMLLAHSCTASPSTLKPNMLQSCSEKLAVTRKSHFSQSVSGPGPVRSHFWGALRSRQGRSDQPVKLLQVASINLSFAR